MGPIAVVGTLLPPGFEGGSAAQERGPGRVTAIARGPYQTRRNWRWRRGACQGASPKPWAVISSLVVSHICRHPKPPEPLVFV